MTPATTCPDMDDFSCDGLQEISLLILNLKPKTEPPYPTPTTPRCHHMPRARLPRAARRRQAKGTALQGVVYQLELAIGSRPKSALQMFCKTRKRRG